MAIKQTREVFQHVLSYPRDAVCIFREIHILQSLNHRNVIGLLDLFSPRIESEPIRYQSLIRGSPEYNLLFKSLGDLYMVTEFVELDLNKVLKAGENISLENVKKYLYQILLGLKHIHSTNVIHRDLRPNHILISRVDHTVKITGFTLSRVVTSNQSTSSNIVEQEMIPSTSILPSGGSSAGSGNSVLGTANVEEIEPCEFPPAPKLMTRQLSEHVVTRLVLCA